MITATNFLVFRNGIFHPKDTSVEVTPVEVPGAVGAPDGQPVGVLDA